MASHSSACAAAAAKPAHARGKHHGAQCMADEHGFSSTPVAMQNSDGAGECHAGRDARVTLT